ncbi:MAG TPA: chemotaxis protein CheB, partial [Gammaproteobacteria bacterium]|nr:chemotaxis protein CheB [Gammaproteobacteria bacterium]
MAREIEREQVPAEPPAEAAARAEPFVVAIGASAGGLEALRTLFGNMPGDSGATFVVVAHRSPHQDSRLVELLQPYTELPVRAVERTTPLEPDTVFILQPSAGVTAVDTHARLTTAAARSGDRARIDQLFRAVAAGHGGRSIGVLLTGAGSDGAIGLRQIKDAGGLVIVQEPEEAEYDGMPRSAIEAGAADLVLPLREIAQAIPRYCNSPLRLSPTELRDVGAAGEPAPLVELCALLSARVNRDFSVYESSFVADRVAKRMRLRGLDRFPEYLRLIAAEADESIALASDLLQNATQFFGDAERARRLEQDLLPQIFDRKSTEHDAVRVWCVGCGTGENAYSVAMQLLEESMRRRVQPHVQVFASDPVEDLLQRARLGLYPPEIADSVSAVRLANFFMRDERGYRVRPLLRRAVTFACHDVFSDFPFAHLDLIVCRRRLLHDLKPGVRRSALHSFHFALEP